MADWCSGCDETRCRFVQVISVLRFQNMSSMEQDGVPGSTQSGAGQRQLDPQEEVSNYIDLLQVDNTYITTGSEVSCFPFLGM